MINFYDEQQFETLMVEVMGVKGLTPAQAYFEVCKMEREELKAHELWADSMERELEIYHEFG